VNPAAIIKLPLLLLLLLLILILILLLLFYLTLLLLQADSAASPASDGSLEREREAGLYASRSWFDRLVRLFYR